MGIEHINDKRALCEAAFAHEYLIVDYYSTNCGPCKQIAPKLEQLALEYPHVAFRKINIDLIPEFADNMGISVVPTFHIYERNKIVDKIAGANLSKIKAHLSDWSATGHH